MAYNPVEELKKGKIWFLSHLSNYNNDITSLIDRIRASEDIDDILRPVLYKLKHNYPRFLYRIIYDNPKYEKTAYALYKEHYDINSFNIAELYNLYIKTNYGKILITHHYKELMTKGDSYANQLISMFLINKDEHMDILKEISLSKDLHIRYLFMRNLVKFYPNSITDFYDDITKYYTSYTYQDGEQMTFMPQLMNDEDICSLCMDMLDNNSEYYRKTKDFILNNYEENSLASIMLQVKNPSRLYELKVDADRIFETSKDYKTVLYSNYSEYISKEILDKLAYYMKYFKSGGWSYTYDNIYYKGLGNKLEKLVDKYLSLSKSTDYKFLGSGSTTSSFKIGDYCFKLSQSKWSYEDIICPNIYLILKDLEEIYLRNERGIIQAGIEVQPYLSKSLTEVSSDVIYEWYKELDRLGYIYKDKLISGQNGANAMLLNDYRDANCGNPERLPDWFKENPLVLVDRDMVYAKDRPYKQQASAGY